MRKIVFGFISFGTSLIATAAIAAPPPTIAPAAQSMIQQVQKFGWPDRPGGHAYSCDAVQANVR